MRLLLSSSRDGKTLTAYYSGEPKNSDKRRVISAKAKSIPEFGFWLVTYHSPRAPPKRIIRLAEFTLYGAQSAWHQNDAGEKAGIRLHFGRYRGATAGFCTPHDPEFLPPAPPVPPSDAGPRCSPEQSSDSSFLLADSGAAGRGAFL